jgi:copper chaperone
MNTFYTLKGMTCGHCVKSVEKEFSKLGITAKADLKSESVSLDIELDLNRYNQLKDTLQEEGYELGSKI